MCIEFTLPSLELSLYQNYFELVMLSSIDHSHIVLIIGDLNGLGHLPEFANQIYSSVDSKANSNAIFCR